MDNLMREAICIFVSVLLPLALLPITNRFPIFEKRPYLLVPVMLLPSIIASFFLKIT